MSDLPAPTAHLDDAALNEFLDQALTPAQHAAAQAHLAACADCAQRLEALRALFTDLDSLPDIPLRRDLAAAVVAQLPRRPTPALRPALRWVVAAQALLAIVLLAASVPRFLPEFAWPTATAPIDVAVLASLSQLAAEASALARSLTAAAEQGLTAARDFSTALSDSAASAWAALLIPLWLLWLLGNGVLVGRLRARPPHATAFHPRSRR